MRVYKKLGLLAVISILGMMLSFSTAAADATTIWDHFPTAGEVLPDNALEEARESRGGFILVPTLQSRPLFFGHPAYDEDKNELVCPGTMYDPATKIGMSVVHLDGDNLDVNGCLVGLPPYQVSIKDGSFDGGGFNNPGYEEVHTNIVDMVLRDSLGNTVTAGIAQGGVLCPGEVQSNAGTGLPGQSFFELYAEVELVELIAGRWGFKNMLFYNAGKPIRLYNDFVDSLPPHVVYVHKASTAIPMDFSNDNPPFWNQGDRVGYLTLAGHGMGYGKEDKNAFWDELNVPENIMPLPYREIPTTTNWGIIILCALLFASLVWIVWRKKRSVTAGV